MNIVVIMVMTNGTVNDISGVAEMVNEKRHVQFCFIDCLKGGPTLRIIAERMY
jgi:hypothetical protein